jgi:hypothetical protein
MHDGGNNKPARLAGVLPAFLEVMQYSGLKIRSLWDAVQADSDY